MSRVRRQRIFEQFEQWGFDARGWTPTTRIRYRNRVRSADRWLEEHRGTSIAWARHKDLQAYLFATPPTARNRNNIRQALVAFGEFLVARGWTEVNAASALPRLPQPRDLPKPLEADQARRIAVGAQTLPLQDRAMVLVYLYGGLRNAEARNLEWAQVSEGCAWLRIRGKGDKVRDVPLNIEAAGTLKMLWAARVDPRYVFPSPVNRGRPISSSYVHKMFRELGEAIGIHGLHAHLLRHTAATALLDTGADLRDVQEFLGHSDPGTTAGYTKVKAKRLREAADRLDFRGGGGLTSASNLSAASAITESPHGPSSEIPGSLR